MARYIDADLLHIKMEDLYEHHIEMRNFSADGAVADCLDMLDNAPTADVVEANQWISVKEKLPPDFIDVLVYHKYSRRVCRGFYTRINEKWFVEDEACEGVEKDAVTHWQNQPHLPKNIESLCEMVGENNG